MFRCVFSTLSDHVHVILNISLQLFIQCSMPFRFTEAFYHLPTRWESERWLIVFSVIPMCLFQIHPAPLFNDRTRVHKMRLIAFQFPKISQQMHWILSIKSVIFFNTKTLVAVLWICERTGVFGNWQTKRNNMNVIFTS